MAPSSSCHSAVFFRSPFLITLEIIVPEKTPLGNVTYTPLNKPCRGRERNASHKVVKEPNRASQTLQPEQIVSKIPTTLRKCLSSSSSSA